MRKQIALIILSVFFTFFAGCAVNPVTGEKQVMLYGDEVSDDIAMGKQASEAINNDLGIDPEEGKYNVPLGMANYVNYVGQKIAGVSHSPDLNWHYTVIEDESVNAFALPGGYIYITTGMLKNLETEAQLAAILAHETLHVTARHSAADMSRQTLIGAAISIATNEDTASAMRAVKTIAQLENLGYSRKQEKQADLYGLDYLVRAGYDPYAMAETMEILDELNKSRSLEFFSTHPNPANRRDLILEKIREKGYTFFGDKNSDDYSKNVLSYFQGK